MEWFVWRHSFAFENEISQKGYFDRRIQEMVNISSGGMLTEFSTTIGDEKQIKTEDICDELQISWIGWEYKTFAGALVNGTWLASTSV